MAKNRYRLRREARIAELRAQAQVLSDERVELEEVNEREDAAPWIGKCFKYRNRDAHGESWWLYLRVVRHDSGNSFIALQCQAQSGGWHIVTTQDHIYLLPEPKKRGYIEITRREFDTAWRRFVDGIVGLNQE